MWRSRPSKNEGTLRCETVCYVRVLYLHAFHFHFSFPSPTRRSPTLCRSSTHNLRIPLQVWDARGGGCNILLVVKVSLSLLISSTPKLVQ
jgi:hypothetical protein